MGHAKLFNRQVGFTLIELLFVIGLVGVLSALTMPAMTGLLSSIRIRSAADQVFIAMMLTRSEAIKRNGRAVMCRSSNGTTCATSGGWEQGWIVFGDSKNNAVVDPGETIVLRQQAFESGMLVTSHFTVPGYISYTPLGQAQTVSGAMLMGHFIICPKTTRPVESRKVILSAAGRVRTIKTIEASCL